METKTVHIVADETDMEKTVGERGDTPYNLCVVALSLQLNILHQEKDGILNAFENDSKKKNFLVRARKVEVSTIEELCHDDNAEEYNYVLSLFFKNGDTIDGKTIGNLVTRDEHYDLQYVFKYAGKILLSDEENVLLDFIPAVASYSGNFKGILATLTENMTQNSRLTLAVFLRGLNTYIRTKYNC